MDLTPWWRPPQHMVYLDFEVYYDPKSVTLERMTLRQYLAAAMRKKPDTHGLLGVSIAVDNGPVRFYPGLPPFELIQELEDAANSDDWVFAAHNAAFDIRVLRHVLGVSQPQRVWCSLEMACAAWPNQPGGYSLDNLARCLMLPHQKFAIDLAPGKHTPEELEAYCNQDVTVGRDILLRAVARMPSREVAVAEMTNAARELHLEVDMARVASAVDEFTATIDKHAKEAIAVLGDDGGLAFGLENGTIKSVKPQTMKQLLLDNLGFDTQTISKKKLNPEKLRRNQEAADVIENSSAANKALWFKRAISKFAAGGCIDVELGYHRAHTGRFSSPQPGSARGINFHNLPKRNPVIAKPIRSTFRLPPGYCAVRGDLSNVEYRIEGWLTHCAHIEQLFASQPLADPYAAFWYSATMQQVVKKDPARQVAKNSVLGLGYLMGIGRWIEELLRALADPTFKVSLDDLNAICLAQNWGPPTDRWVKAQMTKHHAPWQVAAVAYQTREAFHKIHPEFRRLAIWLDEAVNAVNRSVDPPRTIDKLYALPHAPDRGRLDLVVDDTLDVGRNLRVNCGDWVPTVTWRDLGMRDTKFGYGLTSVQAGNKGHRMLTKNIMLENVTQATARNALVKGQLDLWRMGYRYQLSVHDELFLIVPTERRAVLNARDALLRVFGPGNSLGYDWAVLINPSEVTVTQSLWESEDDVDPGKGDRWGRIEADEPGCLERLP